MISTPYADPTDANRAVQPAFLRRRGRTHWPVEVEQLAGAAPDLPSFESHRRELPEPHEDPLA